MSLMVWLPLNGDIKNQGLLGPLTATGTPTYADGKIGKALSNGGCSMSAEQTAQVLNNNEVSISCWIYPNATAGTSGGILFGKEGMGANNNRKFSVFLYPTVNDLHLSWQNDTANTTFFGTIEYGIFPSNKWTHLAIVYNNPNVYIYLNGGLYKTYTNKISNSSTFAYDTTVIHSSNKRIINDFRIYNHALSTKEVKEISKGLVLHYKLTGIGQENLLKNTNFDSRYTGSATTSQHANLMANNWGGYNSGVGNATTVYHAHLTQHDGQYVYRYVRNSSNSWLGISQYIKDQTAVGVTYTFSCELYRVSGTNYPNGGHYTKASSTASNSFVTNYSFSAFANAPVGQWIRYSATMTVPASCYINDGVYFYIYGHTGGSGEFLMRHPKLEVGNKATPWIPGTSDAIYSSLGFNAVAVQDSSGYNYDGTTSSIFTYTSDCIRYNTTANFVSDKKIYTPVLPTSGLANSYTIAWWAKTSSISGKMFWGFSNGNRLNLYGGIYCNTGDGSSNPFVGVSAPSLNVWHHYAMVGNGSTVGLYVDGVLKGNATTYKSITGTRIYLNGWSSGTEYDFNGLMNDFRIYATALSATDIKELYQIPISVDKSGNAFAMEFIENQKPEFHKNGTIENSYIHENEADDSDTLKTFHISKTKTFANQILEV